jgi:hypothetical protein
MNLRIQGNIFSPQTTKIDLREFKYIHNIYFEGKKIGHLPAS